MHTLKGWILIVLLVATPAVAQTPPPAGNGQRSFSELARSFLPPAGDVAMTQVVSLFGPAVTAATGFEASAQASVLGVTIGYFLVGVFVVSVVMALYLVLAGTAQTANSGKFLGERWSGLWVPLRAVLGWMMLVPLPALGGLAGYHALLFWVLAIGTGFANKVGIAGIDAANGSGFVANANALAAEPLASLMARNTFNSLTCVETINKVESAPNGYPSLDVSTSEEAPKPGLVDQIRNFFSGSPKAAQYNDLVNAAAAKHGVPAAFIHAIISAESSYNPRATSPKGAMGLMQLMPGTAKRFGVTDAYDPAQNIDGGTRYLAWLIERYRGDLSLAAAGYNAGEGAVDRYGGVPPYRETRDYVSKVMGGYNQNAGGLPAETAGTTLRHYLFGGGKYAADLCGKISIPIRTVASDTAANGVQTAMRNDIQTAQSDAFGRLLAGMREVVALVQSGQEIAARERYAQLVQDYAQTVFQAGTNAYQTRQAEMIARWKDAAKKDGWATYGMWFWQLSEASISVTTALNEMLAEQNGFKSELTSLTKETADQVRLAIARNDAVLESLYNAGQSGTQNFASWRAVQNGSAGFNYTVPGGGRAIEENLSDKLFRQLSRGLNEAFKWALPTAPNEFPLLTWSRFGHGLMVVGVTSLLGAVGAGIFSTTGGLLVAGLGGFIYFLGWTLAVFMSYLPFLIWLAQVMAWLLLAVAAAFGGALWMLMLLSGEGDGIGGARAQSGFGLMLGLLLRPVLLIFGLFAAIALIYVLGWFLNQTLGTTFASPPNSLFEMMGLIVIYVLMIVVFAPLCLSMISLLPELAFQWIDVVVTNIASGAQSAAETGLRDAGHGPPGSGPLAGKLATGAGARIRKWFK